VVPPRLLTRPPQGNTACHHHPLARAPVAAAARRLAELHIACLAWDVISDNSGSTVTAIAICPE